MGSLKRLLKSTIFYQEQSQRKERYKLPISEITRDLTVKVQYRNIMNANNSDNLKKVKLMLWKIQITKAQLKKRYPE